MIAGAIWAWRNYGPADDKQASTDTNGSEQSAAERSYPLIDLQPTIDEWASRQSGTASVVIYDLANDKTAASLNPDRQYFAASIYKLYVAYEGYKKVADGTYEMDDPYLSGYSRGECLDAMIRESYSPCGEKMWNELGKENLTRRLRTYGLSKTSMTALNTSASDAAIILRRLAEKRDLTDQYTNLFMDSLKSQPAQYRRGLPSGFNQAAVYNKVGWNLTTEWHDTAIITLPNGRSYVVAVFTENVGYRQIAALGSALEPRLTQ